jgi:hypothetical protein
MHKGFFGSLFDLSFRSLITTRIVKLLYVISIIVIGLGALAIIAIAFNASTAAGVVTLIIVAPLYALVYLIWTRVVLELVIVLFRIMENTQELVEQGRRPDVPPAPAAPPSAA